MSTSDSKNLAPLRILQILLKHSDYDHPLTQEKIIKYLWQSVLLFFAHPEGNYKGKESSKNLRHIIKVP